MATQNVVAFGGRTSGGSTVQLDGVNRQVADNTGLMSTQSRATGEDVMNLPTLDAAAMDRLFGLMANPVSTGRQNSETGESEAANYGDPNVLGSLGGGREFNGADSPYSGLGWDLGWNTAGSVVRRGSAAFGLRENSAYYGDTETGEPRLSGTKYTNLDKIAEFAKIDANQYKNPDGSTNEMQLKAAVDNALKDFYLVSGDVGGIPGQTAKPFEFASSLYKRDGETLRPISGTQQKFQAPENSAGHFRDELVGPLSVLLAPILSGFGITGAAGSLTTGISSATGLSPFWSNVIGQAGIKGTMSAAAGGDFGKGLLSGAVGAAAPTFIGQGANAIAGPDTLGANVLNVAGRVGLTAALNGGNLSPMAIVGSLVDTLGGKQGSRTRVSK